MCLLDRRAIGSCVHVCEAISQRFLAGALVRTITRIFCRNLMIVEAYYLSWIVAQVPNVCLLYFGGTSATTRMTKIQSLVDMSTPPLSLLGLAEV